MEQPGKSAHIWQELPKMKIIKKKCKINPLTKIEQMTLTFDMKEGELKTDILKRFRIKQGNDNARILSELARSLSNHRQWGLIRPPNGGYSYMRFFPKNNPTSYSFYFQGPRYEDLIDIKEA